MNGRKLLAGGALLLIAQGVAAFEEEDIELTMHDEFYSQNAFVVSTGVEPNANLQHTLDGIGVRWQYSSGGPTAFFSVQYPGPDTCDEGEWLTVAVTHRAWLGQEDVDEVTALLYQCEGEEPE